MKEVNVKGCRVTMERSQHGQLEPRIELQFAKGTNFRKVHAALHRLAATVESATPEAERWIVQTIAVSAHDAGRLYLELFHASDEEAERGLAILQRVSRADYAGVLE